LRRTRVFILRGEPAMIASDAVIGAPPECDHTDDRGGKREKTVAVRCSSDHRASPRTEHEQNDLAFADPAIPPPGINAANSTTRSDSRHQRPHRWVYWRH
jgi:hypothetical protein